MAKPFCRFIRKSTTLWRAFLGSQQGATRSNMKPNPHRRVSLTISHVHATSFEDRGCREKLCLFEDQYSNRTSQKGS